MESKVCHPQDLRDEERSAWDRILHEDPRFRSPFFSSTFAAAAGRADARARVGVFSENGSPVGFFPFQHRPGPYGGCVRVGDILSDYEGIVAREPLPIDISTVLRRCGVHVLTYDHLPEFQTEFGFDAEFRDTSPIVEVGGKFDQYWDVLKARHRRMCQTLSRKRRKAERELGRLQIEFHTGEEAEFERLLKWKRAQYRRTSDSDLLAVPERRAMLHELSRSVDPLCAGRVAVLRAGDTPVAAHLGLQCMDRLHYWFPAYDPEFGRYSFGQLLLIELIRAGVDRGVRHIDLGKGASRYKNELATTRVRVGAGEVWRRTPRGFLTKACNSLRWRRNARRQAAASS